MTRKKVIVLAGIVLALALSLSAWLGTARAQVTERVSVDSAGLEANGSSSYPSSSTDGRYVAFHSAATNLVTGDTNSLTDIFVRDRDTGATTRVSVDSGGAQASGGNSEYPAISADGRYVLFQSAATNLVTGDANGTTDIFLHDRNTASTTRVSLDSAGLEANGGSYYAAISADGLFVAFQSSASNLVAGDTNNAVDVFVRDLTAGTTVRASVSSTGAQGDSWSYEPALSADGGYVTFYARATNLVTDDLNGKYDIFVHDLDTSSTTRVSVDSAGVEANGSSNYPAISADGRYVTFQSAATNLVTGDTSTTTDIFVHDRDTGETTRVSVDSAGTEGDSASRYPCISADGRHVAFDSFASNLVTGDTNDAYDVFVHDRDRATTARVSVDSAGSQGNGSSLNASISNDGRYVMFGSYATNLASGDTNGVTDVFASTGPPVITGLDPTQGSSAGGTVLTITGSNFTGTMSVTFGGVSASTFTVNSDTQITATSPAHAEGTVQVQVATAWSTSLDTSADDFTYMAGPSIGSIDPTSGVIAGGTSVVISGAGFTGASAVTFGGVNAADFTVDSDTQITATTPAGSAGPALVQVTSPWGTTSDSVYFTYAGVPTLTGVDPDAGPAAGGDSVVITGTNFVGISGPSAVTFGGTAAASCTVDSSTQITATTPAGSAGPALVQVTAAGGTTSESVYYTYVDAPTVTGLDPAMGPTVGGTSVTVTGTGFTGASAVTFGGVDAGNFTVDSDTQITATSPAHAEGTVPVQVTTVGGTSTDTEADDFVYLARYEQTDSHLVLGGSWYSTTVSSASGGSHAYVNTSGAYATISFEGTYLAWIAKSAPNYGIASVSVDGGTAEPVDLYSADLLWQEEVWNTGTLSSGAHIIKIVWTGTKNPSATSTNLSLDALDVIGTLTQAPSRYEQTDSQLVLGGSWSTTTISLASGGSHAYVNASGASATISFEGTYLAWIAKSAPNYGIANVSVDGGAAESVDLYSADTLWRQEVWSTGPLSPGAHTVRIERTGARNPSATAANLSLDALDVMGTLTQAPTRYEQSDTRVAYMGTWNLGFNASASAITFAYANSTGASATISFEGTYLGWVTKTAPNYGIANVSVDGGTAEQVDLYSADTLWQQNVWNTGTLSSGAHTVKIAWTGTRNASSTANSIGVDALDVIGSLTQAPTRYEQTDSHLAYAGTWNTSGNALASGSTFAYANSAGATVSLGFTGTAVTWITKTAPNYGIANVSVDGGTAEPVDLYSADTLWQQEVWAAEALSPGAHSLEITWTGTKNESSTGTNIGLDALDLVIQAPTRFEQSDTHLTYYGTWSSSAHAEASNLTFYYTNASGAYATICFSGNSFTWVSKTAPNYGIANVSVDGGTAEPVDLYSAATVWKQPVWTSGELTSGLHTVVIEWTGTKNESSSDTNISLDAVDVGGALVQAPTRYEQGDTHLAYAGTWNTSGNALASGSTFAYANTPGASLSLSFTGTSLTWITKTAPNYGIAEVSVDGGTAVQVDLYSADTYWKQEVWTTGELTSGLHTLLITWTGTMNENSTGTNIAVDALDVVGSLN